MKNTSKFISVILCIFLLTGCAEEKDRAISFENRTAENNEKIIISAPTEYASALSKVSERIESNIPGLKILFSEKDADIIITDRLPSDSFSEYMSLEDISGQIKNTVIPELTVKNGNDIIGIPLFLKIESYWFDNLYYQANSKSVPFSLSAVKEAIKSAEHGAIFDRSASESFFWSTLAPYYLASGGTENELGFADFNREKLTAAAESTARLFKEKIVSVNEAANELFLSERLMFYITDVSEIAAERHSLPINSEVSFAPDLIFDDGTAELIVRSAFIAVKKALPKALVNKFLGELYSNEILLNIIKSSGIPLACRIEYNNNSVPELVSGINAVLSSPDVNIHYINCFWNEQTVSAVNNAINIISKGNHNAKQAINILFSE